MKKITKAIIAILLILSLSVLFVGCGQKVKITSSMENIVREAIRTGEAYLRGQTTTSEAHGVFSRLNKESSEIAERYNNDDEQDLYRELLYASTDVLLLGTYISMGTESEIKEQIAELEEYLD